MRPTAEFEMLAEAGSRREEKLQRGQGSAALSVEWRAQAGEIPAEIWEQCFPAPLEGRWFYETLEQSELEAQFSFAYALVKRGDAIMALAPTFTAILPISLVAPEIVDKALSLGGRALAHLRFQKTLFVGAPCVDEGSVGTLPGVSFAEVAPTLQRALWQRAREIRAANLVWKDFPEPYWATLRRLAPEAGLAEAVSYPGTRIADIGGDFDDYLATLTGNRRHNLRKKLRLSRAAIALRCEIVAQADEALIDEVWSLFQNTYAKATTKFEKLTRRFWERATRQRECSLIVLRRQDDGRAVAFMLVIIAGKRAINKFIGIDYELGAKTYLYFRLWEEFLLYAMRSRLTEVQSGQTGYRAKLDLGHELVPLNNFYRYRNPIVQVIARLVAKRISWASLDADLEQAAQSRGWRWGRDRPGRA